jgi:hypothetical protein
MTRVNTRDTGNPVMRANPRAALMMLMLTAATVAATATASVAAGRAAAQSAQSGQSGPPLDEASAKVRLAESSRHGEYVDITVPGGSKPIRVFVVYPEIATKAPVVIVMHESFGLTDWIRGVTDQLAADGFIAIAPDLSSSSAAKAPDSAALQAVHAYGTKLPAATGKTTTLQLQGPSRVENWAGTLASLRQQVQ